MLIRRKWRKVSVRRESPAPTNFTPDEQEGLQSLFFTEMHWRRNDIADPAPATCAWLLEHPTYRMWLNQGHGLLWVKGNPGTGKSTVLKHALETAEQSSKQAFILASFFFHGRGVPIQKDVLGLFRSLLHQILQQTPDLLSKFTALYKRNCQTMGPVADKWDWQANDLQNFFKSSVVDAAKTYPIQIYIDALDECGEDVAIELVEFFRCFADPVSICFSCRHYPFVALKGGDEVCVENENEHDIGIYIQDKIETHIQQTNIAEAIRNELLSRSQRNFQWVVLVVPRVIKLLNRGQSMITIQRTIRNIPDELNKLYAELLSGIEEHERVQSLHFMQWICFAARPLTLTQLRFALAMNPDSSHTSIEQCQNSDLYVETDKDMRLRAHHLSRGLTEVLYYDSELVVGFIHQSVPDFLLAKGFQVLDRSIAGSVVGHGHLWLSRSCIKYLSMEELQASARSFFGYYVSQHGEIAFGKYSKNYGLHHVTLVERANLPKDDLALLSTSVIDGIWLPIFHIDAPVLMTSSLLHFAAGMNLINVLNAILTQTTRADRTDLFGRTPLSIAAMSGCTEPVELLLDRDDINANHQDINGDTPLSLAAAGGHEAVVEMLIDRDNVDVNHKVSSNGKTPLSLAAAEGHEAVVEMLTSRDGVDVDSENLEGNTPLFEAAQYWHGITVELLLKRGATLGSNKDRRQAALRHAAANGHYWVVKLWYEQSVDPYSKDHSNRTPLSDAASNTHYEIAKLPSQEGITADGTDKHGRTPLSYACGGGYKEIVELIVGRSDVDIDSKDWSGRTPLSYAASSGHVEVVNLLVKRSDVDINIEDLNGRTALSLALVGLYTYSLWGEGCRDVVDLLLHHKDICVNGDEKYVLMKYAEERKDQPRYREWCDLLTAKNP